MSTTNKFPEWSQLCAVVQEAGEHEELLSLLNRDLFATPASLNAFESVLDDSSLDAIQHHLNLEDNLTDILELAKSQSDINEATKILNSPDLNRLKTQLTASTQKILRIMKQNPSFTQKLVKFASKRHQQAIAVAHAFKSLKRYLEDRCTLTTEAEQPIIEQISAIRKEQERDAAEIAEIETKMEMQKQKFISEISDRDAAIRKLENESRRLRQQSDDALSNLYSETEQLEIRNAAEFEVARQNAQQRCVELAAQLDRLRKNSITDDTILRRKNNNTGDELNSILDAYETEMIEKTKLLKQQTLEYEDECAEVRILSDFFTQLDADRARAKHEAELKAAHDAQVVQEEYTRTVTTQHLLALFQGFQALCPPAETPPKETPGKSKTASATKSRPATAKKK